MTDGMRRTDVGVFSKSNGELTPQSFNGVGNEVKPHATAASSKSSPDAFSTLGAGMVVTGNIVCEGSLRIFGRLIGDIHASHLVICEGAQVQGKIIAQETTIEGVFKGTIHGNSVSLQSTAVVDGEIYSKSLTVEKNADFEGVARRLDKPVDPPSIAQPALSSSIADASPEPGPTVN
jgi:cytoskeletal protein CcmA (bactofilin family)